MIEHANLRNPRSLSPSLTLADRVGRPALTDPRGDAVEILGYFLSGSE
jgi:hypothetical protein